MNDNTTPRTLSESKLSQNYLTQPGSAPAYFIRSYPKSGSWGYKPRVTLSLIIAICSGTLRL